MRGSLLTKGSSAGGDEGVPVPIQTRVAAGSSRARQGTPNSNYFPRSAFRAWPEIRSQLRAADPQAILLDFDGTLVNLRPAPGDVEVPAGVRRMLQRLVGHANLFVAVVSGRRVRDLRGRLGVEGLRYFGLHGAERDGESRRISQKARVALARAKRDARLSLSDLPGIWIEDKSLAFAVHYRSAGASAVQAANERLFNLVAKGDGALHVLNGSRVWEILPREIPGKSVAVKQVLGELPAGAPVVYIGDDGTDEVAFAVLQNQITIRVGREHGTRARYYVRTPADVLRFLARLEGELR